MLKKNALTETKKQEIEEITVFAAEDIIDLSMTASMKSQFLKDTYRAYGLNNYIRLRDFILKVDDKIKRIHYGIL